jgi:hypothetical protein
VTPGGTLTAGWIPRGGACRWKGRAVVKTQGEHRNVSQGEEPRKASWYKRFVDWVALLFT